MIKSGSVLKLFAVLALTAAVGPGRGAWAQEVDDDGNDLPEPALMVAQPQFMVAEEQFDQWVFGNLRNTTSAREHLKSKLAMQVDEIDRISKLNDAQKAKLRLAAAGDLKRVFERIEEKRKQFQLVRTDQQKFGAFYQEIQPLQQSLQQGIFGDGSLFSKTITRTLDSEQNERYQKIQSDRRRYRYRSRIDLAVALIDNAAGLSAEQRRRLTKLIVDETREPSKFGQYDYLVVVLQLSKLPEAKVKPIFSDVQWRLLGQQFAQAKGMEPFLKQNGFFEEPPEKPADGPPK